MALKVRAIEQVLKSQGQEGGLAPLLKATEPIIALTSEEQTNSPTHSTTAPLVSVVMPTYNYAQFIGEAIRSLQSQTYQNWECLIVDDGSTDATPDVVAELVRHDARVKSFRQQNQRQAAAKNLGLQNARGKYVLFLDADDLVEPRKLESQVDYLENHSEVDIVYGGVRYFTAAGVDESLHSVDEDNLPWMPEISGQGREMIAVLLRKNTMVINAALVRRAVIDEVGSFDERLPPAEDWDYWLRCAVAGKTFQYEDVEGARALVRAHSVSSSRNRVGMYNSMRLMREKFSANTTDAELLTINREMAAADQGYLGIEEAASGHLLKGMRELIRAAAFEQRTRGRAKWFLCALAAPFLPKQRLLTMIGTSLTDSAFGLRRK